MANLRMLASMRLKRHPFILLELFLALALISLSLVPIASYPFKIYQKELTLLIEMQLQETAEIAFRDLLLDLTSYVDPETLEPYTESPETIYPIILSNTYKWDYVATWELHCKPPSSQAPSKTLLQATLLLIPQGKSSGFIKAPQADKIFFEYFIAKKSPPSQGEINGNT